MDKEGGRERHMDKRTERMKEEEKNLTKTGQSKDESRRENVSKGTSQRS